MRPLAPILLLTTIGLLGGCASLSDKECKAANWQAIGQRDGASGYTPSRLDDHIKACGEYGIRPDPVLWARGREQGPGELLHPQVGRTKGVEGASYYNVCSGGAEVAFLRGYGVGKQIHDLKKLQDTNHKRRKELTDQLGKKDIKEEDSKRIKRDLERLDSDDRRLQRLVEQAYQIPI